MTDKKTDAKSWVEGFDEGKAKGIEIGRAQWPELSMWALAWATGTCFLIAIAFGIFLIGFGAWHFIHWASAHPGYYCETQAKQDSGSVICHYEEGYWGGLR